ncbi:hypothetical protein PHYBLDRAFT_77601 [Phycomyces blakesleeanus NRRL 1555(-)]|uniref:Uncharacterized protein n=1 Tax=Phycomyces blakesleeanus (strain ATCC 8743b / DSM 1359 / FGSC 10004 / NBRC 33097 / NRRL 1555) TaxID=763407 RepID=A0A167LP03_PHYB8|nr:hypothetical protein PHYBLDRAFT_77601 [Phycomyces blakesleeanus NRRL 1555(-)]OAD70824.1 hypothetical protein PHYBLDRAFT_77601 [Phycomyces blakesleeanus NRRL 1555(-)]|eukprot:XP_018288864.1 hypothetical protein PHYBLDRAFT_77601 [Phycomyces blakesleeanus NRRL 1555(-)]
MADDESPFQFDFDDDVFLTERIRSKPETVKVEYEAKQETDGWFHSTKNYEVLMLERHGPNQLKSAIEHDYLYKRYERALEGALAFIHISDTNPACKINNTREMCEIAIHSAVRLNNYALAEKILDRKQPTMELGPLLLKGAIYPHCNNRHGDALASLVDYSQQRRLDYAAWRQMAAIFMDAWTKDKNLNENPEEMRINIAFLCLQRAHRIMTSSRWFLKSEFVRRRYERELKVLVKEMEAVEQGDAGQFVAWINGPKPNAKAAGLGVYKWKDIEWIACEWTSLFEEEEEQVKVADL